MFYDSHISLTVLLFFQLEHDQHPSVEEILDVRASFNKFPFSVESLPTVYYVSLSHNIKYRSTLLKGYLWCPWKQIVL